MKQIMQHKPEAVTSHISQLGEGPVWDESTQSIYWTDIPGCSIQRFSVPQKRLYSHQLNCTIGSFALRKSGGLVAATENGFAFLDLEESTIQWLKHPEEGKSTRFNEGKCDPHGRFWAGTMGINKSDDYGGLYTLNHNLSVTPRLDNVGCSNGLAWSPDAETFYYIDTPTRYVAAFDYNIEDGAIRNKRIIIEFNEEDGYPDGMTVDKEGMLWIALWNGWTLNRYSPRSGMLLDSISLPVSRVSSCTFGGQDLQELYITTAREGLTDEELQRQPLAGSLFVVKNSGYEGLPAVRFAG